MSEPCCMADAHGQACTCRERLYTQAELDAAVQAEREAIANGIEAKIGQHVHPQSLTADVLRDLAAAIRERGK